MSQGVITVGDLTSLLMYTVYVGTGLQMLTCDLFLAFIYLGTKMTGMQAFLCRSLLAERLLLTRV